jgi:hypothetical protein
MNKMVRCLFKVIEKAELEKYPYDESKTFRIKLFPMQSEPFGRYTPSGSMELLIKNDSASEQFIVGQQYYVDIYPADDVKNK